MRIIGCDFHTRYQQIAMLDRTRANWWSGGWSTRAERRESFIAELRVPVRVGIEATGHMHWFEALLAELGHELWMEMRPRFGRRWCASRRRTRGMRSICWSCCAASAFRIWRPSAAERDLRQLVWHRQKLVWMRGAVKNQMHALAMGEGVCRKKKLFTAKGRQELEGLALGPWASYRRQELLRMFDELQAAVARPDQAVEQAAEESGAGGTFDDTSRSGAGHVAGFCAHHRTVERFNTASKW